MVDNTDGHYKVVQDQGGFKGAKCSSCGTVRWTFDFDPVDHSTGKPCPNCQWILDNDIWTKINS